MDPEIAPRPPVFRARGPSRSRCVFREPGWPEVRFMKIHAPQTGRTPRRMAHSAALLAFVLGSQAGCSREFFREWANQDASEAIFEKSRDPRWRLDMFSMEPPALSRYADPYDPDHPPAPPD